MPLRALTTVSLTAVVLVLSATAAARPNATRAQPAPQRRCRRLVKKVHGRKRSVLVCRKVKPKPKPNRKPTHITIRLPDSVFPANPQGLVSAFGSVWVPTENLAAVHRIDPTTNSVVASVPETAFSTTDAAQNCGTPVAAFGSLWVSRCGADGANEGRIARINPTTNAVITEVPGVAGGVIGAGAGSVWAPTNDGKFVARIDPATNTATKVVAATGHVFSVWFDFGSAWAADYDAGTLLRIDPATNTVTATIPVGPPGGPTEVTSGEGKVWVVHQDSANSVYAVDPATNQASSLSVPVASGSGAYLEIALGSGWVRTSRAEIARFDLQTGKVTRRFAAIGEGGFVVDFGSLWAAVQPGNGGGGEVWRYKLP